MVDNSVYPALEFDQGIKAEGRGARELQDMQVEIIMGMGSELGKEGSKGMKP